MPKKSKKKDPKPPKKGNAEKQLGGRKKKPMHDHVPEIVLATEFLKTDKKHFVYWKVHGSEEEFSGNYPDGRPNPALDGITGCVDALGVFEATSLAGAKWRGQHIVELGIEPYSYWGWWPW
jgi:hypothetical protein